jgi:hypothetical protein
MSNMPASDCAAHASSFSLFRVDMSSEAAAAGTKAETAVRRTVAVFMMACCESVRAGDSV